MVTGVRGVNCFMWELRVGSGSYRKFNISIWVPTSKDMLLSEVTLITLHLAPSVFPIEYLSAKLFKLR